jgi:hypothetical protein
LSTGSAATDYRRRGADLMAQIRGEVSDDEEGYASGSLREDGSVSTRSSSVIVRSLRETQARGGTHLYPGWESASSFEPIDQLSASIRAVRLEDQVPRPIKPSPRKLLRRLSAADEVSREVEFEGPEDLEGTGLDRSDLPQPPAITISASITPNPPRRQARGARGSVRVVSDQAQRIQSPTPAPAPAHSHLEPQHPSTSPAREDMNRFVSSSSTVHTKSTACSAGSFVKHAGPPASLLAHSGSGVRQIAPTDLPAEALPDRVGRMVYDREAMRWRQEVPDGNVSEGSEDPFQDFESFLSGAGGERSDDEGSAPMDEDDEQEQEEEGTAHGDMLDSELTLEEPIGLSVVEEVAESALEHDSDITRAEDFTNVEGMSPNGKADASALQTFDPTPMMPSPVSSPEPRIPRNLGVDESGVTPARVPRPLRPALKSAASTPAHSAPPSRESTVDPTTPMPGRATNRRSVSFSDGRTAGKIRGLAPRDNESESDMASELTLTPLQSDFAPSSRMQRIGNLLDEMEDDSILNNMSIAPGMQSSGESDEDTTEHSDMLHGDPDVDPDVSRAPRSFARTYSFGGSERGGGNQSRTLGKGNATFLTECSFGVAYDQLVQIITDVHPYQPYWEPLSEINLSKKGIESLARLNEFLPNLDRLDV